MAKGARSLSDFVRHAMHEQVKATNEDSALASTVNHHAALVKNLEQKIEKLSAEIASLRADAPASENDQAKRSTETVHGQGGSEEQWAADNRWISAKE